MLDNGVEVGPGLGVIKVAVAVIQPWHRVAQIVDHGSACGISVVLGRQQHGAVVYLTNLNIVPNGVRARGPNAQSVLARGTVRRAIVGVLDRTGHAAGEQHRHLPRSIGHAHVAGVLLHCLDGIDGAIDAGWVVERRAEVERLDALARFAVVHHLHLEVCARAVGVRCAHRGLRGAVQLARPTGALRVVARPSSDEDLGKHSSDEHGKKKKNLHGENFKKKKK